MNYDQRYGDGSQAFRHIEPAEALEWVELTSEPTYDGTFFRLRAQHKVYGQIWQMWFFLEGQTELSAAEFWDRFIQSLQTMGRYTPEDKANGNV